MSKKKDLSFDLSGAEEKPVAKEKKDVSIPVVDKRSIVDEEEVEEEGITTAGHFTGEKLAASLGNVATTDEELQSMAVINNQDNWKAGPFRVSMEAVNIKMTPTKAGTYGRIDPKGLKVFRIVDICNQSNKIKDLGLQVGDYVLAATNTGYTVNIESREIWYIYETDIIAFIPTTLINEQG